jgi:hypothetical protein
MAKRHYQAAVNVTGKRPFLLTRYGALVCRLICIIVIMSLRVQTVRLAALPGGSQCNRQEAFPANQVAHVSCCSAVHAYH